MPLPETALTVNGGCNCRAIRYRIDIPALKDRPTQVYPSSNEKTEPVHLPMIVTDHCNDCRRATGTVLPIWLLVPTAMVTASFVLRSTASLDQVASKRKDNDPPEVRGLWLPGSEAFVRGKANADSFLTFFESTEGRNRLFCGRCGTPIAYVFFPRMFHPGMEGWVDTLDILSGTVDREDLAKEALAPERQLWWDLGIPWVQRLSDQGMGDLPKHPISDVNELVE
jgi:hypothetical protein